MKKLFAIAVIAALSSTAFATSSNQPAPSQQAGQSEKACYKKERVIVGNPDYDYSDSVDFSVGVKVSWNLVRVPCASTALKK